VSRRVGRSFPASLLVIPALVAALAFISCGGEDSGGDDDKLVLTPVSADLVPVVVSQDLAIGPNRFVMGILDSDNAQVLGADLHLRFFLLQGQDATLKLEADTEALSITKTYTHTHDDGTVESHEAGETGVYVANVEFDAAGQWGVEVTGTVGGQELEPLRPVFEVRDMSLSPGIGEEAPGSVQPILSDVADISEIDTSETPNPEMHDTTIADAVSSGEPTVIVFATPAFCVSQICGPAKQIVDDLFEAYGSQANFIHVEPYDVEKAQSGGGLEILPFITADWGLQSEPWVFVVGRDGKIAGKFEGIVSYEELEVALTATLA